jgi:hypothetical protein
MADKGFSPFSSYRIFREKLINESPKAAIWLQYMVYGIMTQREDLTEDDALEIVCKILLRPERTVATITA